MSEPTNAGAAAHAIGRDAAHGGTGLVTALLVSYNTRNLLDPCLAALARARAFGTGVSGPDIVVDNASRDGSADYLGANHPDVRLLRSERNVGFGRANNLALPFVDSKYLLLLNTDAFVSEDSLLRTVEYMEAHPKCGVLGVRLEGRDGELQPSCRYFPTPVNMFMNRLGLSWLARLVGVRLVDDMAWDHASVRQCDWVPGCFYLIRKEVIDQVGLFDPLYFLYFEEVDHCKAVKNAGWDVVFYPFVTVVHIGGESARSLGQISNAGRQVENLQIESSLIYFRKNMGLGGVVLAFLLSEFTDFVLFLKAALRISPRSLLAYHLKRMRVTAGLMSRTRFGTRPVH